jgi:ApaG protein
VQILITNGIEISVKTQYQEEFSEPAKNKFIFSYNITIVNHNQFDVQLLRRHWIIFDNIGEIKEVEGDGVIGQQPILKHNESFSYSSWSSIYTEIGKMFGNYQLKNIESGEEFYSKIPEFTLTVPLKLN